MFQALRIYLSARRIGLRDKGEIQEEYVPSPDNLAGLVGLGGSIVIFLHSKCKTRVRIGINRHGQTCMYCWRCEEVLCVQNEHPESASHLPQDNIVHFRNKK